MRNQTVRLFLYSSIAIIVLVFAWGFKYIPKQRDLAERGLKSSVEQELSVVASAVRSSTKSLRYQLLDVLKAEGNDHATRAFQDSSFIAASLIEWKEGSWKALWHSTKTKEDFQAEQIKSLFKDWPLSKLNAGEVYFSKVGEVQGQAYFAVLVPVRRPAGIPMIGIGIFPANQFGLTFTADRSREVRVVDDKGFALALTRPAYLGASVRSESLVQQMIDGDEVSVRDQWKNEAGVRLVGAGTRMSDSNLIVTIEAPLEFGSGWIWQSWIFLLFCAGAAVALNWYLVNSLMQPLLAQISNSDAMIEQLKRSLNEGPRPAPIMPENELEDFSFIEPIGAHAVAVPEAGPVKTSLAKIVRAAVRGQEARLKEKGIRVQQTGIEEIQIENDSLQLQTAIEEVLKNAIESIVDGESKWITILGSQKDGLVHLKIEDTGAGIAPEHLEKIFDPFFSTKDEQGVSRGLGLNVVRRVLEEIGGVVKIDNREATQGAVVELSWPVEQAEVSNAVPAAPLAEIADEEDDFSALIMTAPLVASSNDKYPDIAIRKPKVRTLD